MAKPKENPKPDDTVVMTVYVPRALRDQFVTLCQREGTDRHIVLSAFMGICIENDLIVNPKPQEADNAPEQGFVLAADESAVLEGRIGEVVYALQTVGIHGAYKALVDTNRMSLQDFYRCLGQITLAGVSLR